MPDVEQLIQVLLQFAALGGVFARLHESLFEQSSHGWRLVVNLSLVPALLHEIGVAGAVRVVEGDVLDIVAHHLVVRWREIIFRTVYQQRMGTGYHIYEQRLSAAVRTHDSDVLVIAKLKLRGLLQPPFGHPGHSVLYLDDFLHSAFIS